MRAGRKRQNPKNKESDFYHLYECRIARPATNVGGKSCHNKQYRGSWAEPLVNRAIQEVVKRPELAMAAIATYRKVQDGKQVQPDIAQLQEQLDNLQRQEQGTVKAQIAGVMVGADSSIYEFILRDLAAKRNHIAQILAQVCPQPKGKRLTSHPQQDDASIAMQALAAVDEVLNAPDNCLTPAEKQGLLAKVIEAIYPEGKEGLRIFLKPPLVNDPLLNVQYFTT